MSKKIYCKKNEGVFLPIERVTELLDSISNNYEIRIRELENENQKLRFCCQQSLIWRFENRGRNVFENIIKKLLLIIKKILTNVGLKESCKKTKFFLWLKEKRYL